MSRHFCVKKDIKVEEVPRFMSTWAATGIVKAITVEDCPGTQYMSRVEMIIDAGDETSVSLVSL
jgi:hypothetical protein